MPYKRPPTSLRARWLAEQMRRLRKERGVTLKTASRHLGIDQSALARREKAEWPFLDGVASLLDVYQLTNGRRRTTLLHLDAHAHRRDAWHRDDIPPSNPDQQENAVPFPERHRPTVRSQWLAEQLRQLRVDRRLTLQQVGTQLGVDWSSVGRFERGELKLKYDIVTALLDLYHVFDDRQRDQLCSLALDARHGDHWDVDFGDELDYRPYVNLAWLETRATCIRYYATTRIPDLLQTPEYAARLIQTQMGIRHPTPEHQAAVAAHAARRTAFHEGKTRLSAVITETALRTQIGDTHLAEQQLAHLHALANQPRYTIRVLPDQHETAARYDTPFTVFDMPDPYPPVAVTHSLAGRLYLEHPRSLRFTVAHNHLHTAAHDLVPDAANPPTPPNETAGRAATTAAPRTTNGTATARTQPNPIHPRATDAHHTLPTPIPARTRTANR
ncbi:Scr1 family TA system antitoxin-like transcriptional regulator [Polymorphospora sp. NPDC051019]|uniref:Scr1 family TA system antitoxin-like transcriptional regulator n=1 Tax=Polymorphospora sp. NPDC051019 TaxID=3155725 RepID=UPI00344380C1